MKQLKTKRYLLRIAGVNILMLVFGMVFGRYLPTWLNVIIVAGFAVLWFLVYDENTYNLQHTKEGESL